MMKASQFLATDMMEAVKMLMSAGQFVFYVVRPSYDKKKKKLLSDYCVYTAISYIFPAVLKY